MRIEEINAYLPTQKPSEVEWVKKEEEAIKTENPSAVARRLNNLIFSPEYNYYKFKKLLSDAIESLEYVFNDFNGPC